MKLKLILFIFIPLFFSCKKKSPLDNGSNPTPSITSITPNNATTGDPSFTLTVNGQNFSNSSVVRWNGNNLVTQYISATQLTATISDILISLPKVDTVTVYNPTPGGGISNPAYFNCSSSQNNPSPSIISLNPASVNAGSNNFTITVNGNNFISASQIQWNGTPLSTVYVNSGQLTATINSALVTNSGTANISVFNPAPGGGTSPSTVFTITAVGNNPIPSLISISPNAVTAGSGSFTITASGTNFINSSVLNWNGTALTTNYISSNQLTATINASLITNPGTANVTVSNPTPGGGSSSAINFTINSQGTTTKKFLFDATKAETAGNADWVIDADNNTPQKIPTPLQSTITSSTNETYWTGGISSFGIALAKLGHTVETLPSTGSITYGNSSNAQDLSHYDVFVIDEPNIKFTTSEKQAILNFIQNGGGLMMISDHTQSDRNNDGWDSPAIWNDLMTNNGLVTDPFGFSIDLTNISGTSSNILTGNSSNVILHGSQGNVSQIDFSNGATITLNSSSNASVQGLVWQSGYTQNPTHVICASSTYGNGRVFVIGDSSPLDDGTGATSDILYVDWSLYSHTQLFMNASLWLSKLQ